MPLSAVKRHNAIDPVDVEQTTERIGSSLWHSASLEGVECVSTYESRARRAGRLVRNSAIDDVWRRAFGLPNPQPGADESFVPTKLKAELHMAYREDEGGYRTVICGGTATLPVDERFLATQMAAIRAVMERTYPDFGFAAR